MPELAVAEPRLAPARPGLQTSEHRAVLVLGDTAAATVAIVVALWLWSITAGFPFGAGFLQQHVGWFIVAPAWVALLAGARNVRVAVSPRHTIAAMLRAAAMLLAAYLLVYFYAPRSALPRLMPLYVVWECAVLTAGWRLVYAFFFHRLPLRRPVAIVGTGASGRTIASVIQSSAPQLEIVAFVEAMPRLDRGYLAGIPVLHGASALANLVSTRPMSEIILATPQDLGEDLLQILLDCQEAGLRVVRMSAVYEQLLGRVPVAYLEPHWLFSSFGEALWHRDASLVAKRALDVAGGLLGALLLITAAPFAALAIWIDTGLPILFRQTRTGRAGRPFTLLKFRTMISGAEEDGATWTAAHDPRITRVGRWLRASRLDELPQFMNVLRGDMSLVGPRPERPEFVRTLEALVPFYRTRLIARPGVTGWAQINCAYADSVEDAALKLEYDLFYVKHRSLGFDLLILFRTIGTVLRMRGR